ncbi:MAG: hypothetical protein IJ877_06595 [Candidatus Gastranaerophilales bacterium]|nr:hypothetical protein [Candidatus Gastranaerophilales bacterium]
MKILKIITLIFLLTINFCFASIEDIELQLNRMENSIWGFTYQKDDTQKRLTRIEQNVFGKTNQGLTTENRLKKLNDVLGYETKQEEIELAGQDSVLKEEDDVNYPQIDQLEYQIFKETYQKENIYKRLERLEKKIFGIAQEGNLANRTDKLKAYIQKDVVAQDPYYYTKKPYTTTSDVEQYMGSQSRYESDIHIQIAGLETALFSKTYSQDPVGLRLNRLERKIFQRDFSSDDEGLRLQRLQAAANAQQTAKLYEANKIQKYASTGIQLGSIILMILALIL